MSENDTGASTSQIHSTHEVIKADPASPPHDVDDASDHDEGPPAKRRKLSAVPRKEDPNPWNLPKADGPTSFVEGGRRKSGRTNVIPLDLQPQKNRRQTRAAYDKELEDRYKHARNPRSRFDGRSRRNNHAIADVHKAPFADKPLSRGPGRPSKRTYHPPSQRIKMESSSAKSEKQPPWQSRSLYGKGPNKVKKERYEHLSGRRRKLSGPSKGIQAREQTNGHLTGESSDDDTSEATPSDRSPSPPSTLQKIRFRVYMPKPSIQSPMNIPAPKRYASLQEFLDKDDSEPQPGQDVLTQSQIYKEAMARNRIRTAKKPGFDPDEKLMRPLGQQEPKHYAHHDHLMAHMKYFNRLLQEERTRHKRLAKATAELAKAFVENKRLSNKVKTAEEIEQEEIARSRQRYRNVVKDLERLWTAVQGEVDLQRQRLWAEQEEARRKQQLDAVLEKSEQMLERDTLGREGSDIDTRENSGSDEESEDPIDSDNSENMSDEDSGSDSERGLDHSDLDADMSPEALKRKYENLPEPMVETDSDEDGGDYESVAELDVQSSVPPDPDTDNVDDDSDRSTEMDSENDSAEDSSDDEDSDEDESTGRGLLGLFSRREIEDLEAQAKDRGGDVVDVVDDETDGSKLDLTREIEFGEPDTDTNESDFYTHTSENPEVKSSHAVLVDTVDVPNDRTSQDVSTQASPRTTASHRTEPESASSLDHHTSSRPTPAIDDPKSTIKTPVPSLLRATLRPYQHEGLDWLAGLYATGRSGILADEMGLGKTIQSIALLAHLAVEHEIWGPHLIVVPTSVMLNWEMEFKKFCPGFKVLTYYGSQDERKQKRKGWMAEDAFNVCITSYQLVLQDVNSFKRRRWHYMILDEAHNIKNFRSDRWQTMMTFNTHSRLLLTGTPLQNNLTELWSLLFFLRSGSNTESEDDGFAGLEQFSEWFRKPVTTILEHGREIMTEDDKKQVDKLHKVIRPFLLRRLKADVEKQMPLKYEHVELCRLSKRQRQLYDGFMSRAQTKETLASGNYLSIINALMQLRKVCNHPDLFETRPITTSFAMPKSIAAGFEIRDLLVRRKMVQCRSEMLNLDFLNLAPVTREHMSMIEFRDTRLLLPGRPIETLRNVQWQRMKPEAPFQGHTMNGIMSSLENIGRKLRFDQLTDTLNIDSYRHHGRPYYGQRLLKQLKINTKYDQLSRLSGSNIITRAWESEQPVSPLGLVQSIQTRSALMEPVIEKFAFITPTVVASDLTTSTLTSAGADAIRQQQALWPADPFHEARMKLSIAFPDKRLLQYDCGKLQRLDKLLRTLQGGGHRALIFTQMTKVLDILEQFLNIHGHRYLRLDGSTRIEQRQILTDRFNNDNRILAFILSSRSGGLGINLTGADTVIFYDLDWNPAMDKQCTDRAHRIGQTRDVHIYRFVSEHTIESNILRKATQKQMLDDVVIQEGDFTTDYLNKVSYRDMLPADGEDEVGAAMDRVLGNDRAAAVALEQAEDREDVAAAKVAAREVQNADDGDFEDKPNVTISGAAMDPYDATRAAIADADLDEADTHHIDEYMLRLRQWLLKDTPLAPPKDKSKKRKRKGEEHRIRKPRQ